MVSKLLNFWTTGTIIFLKGPNHKHLTSADPLQSGGAGAEIAFQPLGVVAGLRFAAVLVELLGADLTAAAAVPDQPDSRGALGRLQGTVAGGGAGRERLEKGKDFCETRRLAQGGLPREGTGVSDPVGKGNSDPDQPHSPGQGCMRQEAPDPDTSLRGKELPRNVPLTF